MQPHLIDMIGAVSGRLTVIAKAPRKGQRTSARWLCQCTCGQQTTVFGYELRQQRIRSCGCLLRETTSSRRRSHGMSQSREYRAWASAKTRCYNPRIKEAHRYSGRGIAMSPLWRHNFQQFLSDMGPCPTGHTLERVDNNRDYDPSNCIWATRAVQAQNRTGNRMLTLNGITLSTAEWERRLGFNPGVIKRRLQRGWSELKSLSTPMK